MTTAPDVADSAVWVAPNRLGEDQLVGYIVLKGAGPFQQKAVEEHLKTRLPDYMVPRHYLVLEALPTLPTGKVDRRALPNPFDRIEASRPAATASLEPREQEMVNLFKELLQLADVSLDSDFIKMGGDSLLMALLMHRVYQAYCVEINFDAFVESPTPARLAGLIETATVQARGTLLMKQNLVIISAGKYGREAFTWAVQAIAHGAALADQGLPRRPIPRCWTGIRIPWESWAT